MLYEFRTSVAIPFSFSLLASSDSGSKIQMALYNDFCPVYRWRISPRKPTHSGTVGKRILFIYKFRQKIKM
jgi:hypothetical protein